MLAAKPSARRRARWKTSRSISINSIAASSTGHGPPWYLPPSKGGFVQSGGQVTAPLQTSLAGRPVLDPIAGFRDAMTARSLVLERYARDRNGSAAAGSPASAPGGSLHQRPTAPDLSSVNRPPLLKSAAPCAIDNRLGLRSHSRRASSYRRSTASSSPAKLTRSPRSVASRRSAPSSPGSRTSTISSRTPMRWSGRFACICRREPRANSGQGEEGNVARPQPAGRACLAQHAQSRSVSARMPCTAPCVVALAVKINQDQSARWAIYPRSVARRVLARVAPPGADNTARPGELSGRGADDPRCTLREPTG
jgi:hypothetical protein